MTFLCVICQKPVEDGEPGSFNLDPCGLMILTNLDKDRRQRREQEFFVHFDCFRKVVADQDALNIKDAAYWTNGQVEADKLNVQVWLDDLLETLERCACDSGVWDELFAYPRGQWVQLDNLLCGPGTEEISACLSSLNRHLGPGQDVYLTWVDDFRRPQGRIIFATLNSWYEWTGKIIV